MATAEAPAPEPSSAPAGSAPGEKGLKSNAIGFASNVTIGVASTAPGYSLAASLGFVIGVTGIGLEAPAVMILAFVPMLFIAAAYYWMNRADPDCGTTFSWVTKAMGPYLGWMGGWGIAAAGTIVMANLAQIAGLYTFILVGWDGAADSKLAVTALGVVFIAAMTWICVIGIELSARTQVGLLGAEIVTLTLFAVIALVKVYAGTAGPNSIEPAFGWFNPLQIDGITAAVNGVLIAVFIYWGWDSTVSVNEESEDSSRTPGRAAVTSTIILVLIYVIVSAAAQAFNGPEALADQEDALSLLATDVLGSPLDKLVIIAVLTSAAASCQTTILPNARTALSMARQGAFPKTFGEVSPRYLTPANATIIFGVLSVLWYVILTIVAENILFDSIAALGLMIAFYYALTGYACVVYYRRELFKSVRNFLFVGLAPLIGSLMLTFLFFKSCSDLSDPANSESGQAWFGLGPPLVIGIGFLAFGALLMLAWRVGHRDFFKRRREVADPAIVARAPAGGGS
ncbi:MAG: APC family permease [Solirubrobacterales bacterium]